MTHASTIEPVVTHASTIEPVEFSTVQPDKTVFGEPYFSVICV